MLELTDLDVPASKRQKVVPKNNIDTIVNKAIKDSLKGMTSDELDNIRVDGLTCRETIKRDKLAQQSSPGSLAMGKNYYLSIRDKFTLSTSPQKLLQVADQSEVVAANILQAVMAAQATPPHRGPLMQLMDVIESVNQKEVVGLLRLLCSLRPGASSEQLQAGLSILRMIKRLALASKFEREMGIMVPVFEEILLKVPALDKHFQRSASLEDDGVPSAC